MAIQKVGVVGCGLMGSGIAQVSAQAGFQTVVREVNAELVEKGLKGIEKNLARLVEKGTLKTFLLTRTPPLKKFDGSNGRARMSGSFGADGPGFGNLFIRASQTLPFAELKKKLIYLCHEGNKPYGILVRKLDYPSSASIDELRKLAQSSSNTRPAAPPLLVYKVYPDGKEELVRSLRFHGLTTHSLKDIVGASDESVVFDFIDSNAPFALMGAGSFTTSVSVIAPAILFDELELEPVQEETPKPPIVPPPPLRGASTESRSQNPGVRISLRRKVEEVPEGPFWILTPRS